MKQIQIWSFALVHSLDDHETWEVENLNEMKEEKEFLSLASTLAWETQQEEQSKSTNLKEDDEAWDELRERRKEMELEMEEEKRNDLETEEDEALD